MKRQIVLVGGGGHCRSCIDVIEGEGRYSIVGIVDVKERIGDRVLGYKVFASDEQLERLVKRYRYFLVTVGQIEETGTRRRLFRLLERLGAEFPVIVACDAYVSPHASVGKGTIVLHHAMINASARIGVNCILNTRSLVEHDAVVGDHCHIATGAIVNGGCAVGDRVFIGSQSVVANQVRVADDVLIPCGSTVVKSAIVRERCVDRR